MVVAADELRGGRPVAVDGEDRRPVAAAIRDERVVVVEFWIGAERELDQVRQSVEVAIIVVPVSWGEPVALPPSFVGCQGRCG